MDSDERMAYLEFMINAKDDDLKSLPKEIASATKKRDTLLEKEEELTTNESKRLKVIEEDISSMRRREDRLVAEIVKHEAELNRLKNQKEIVDASVPAQGI